VGVGERLDYQFCSVVDYHFRWAILVNYCSDGARYCPLVRQIQREKLADSILRLCSPEPHRCEAAVLEAL
jgi:hypothetical protein